MGRGYYVSGIAGSEGVKADAEEAGLSSPEEIEGLFKKYMVSPFKALRDRGWHVVRACGGAARCRGPPGPMGPRNVGEIDRHMHGDRSTGEWKNRVCVSCSLCLCRFICVCLCLSVTFCLPISPCLPLCLFVS